MAGATLTTLDKILKELYLPPVVEQLNNEVLLLQRLEARSEDIVGRRAVVPVHKGRSSAVGVAAEGAALPTADNQEYDNAIFDLKYLYGRIQVTGPSMAKTAREAGAFLKALQSEIDGIRNDLKKDLARQVYGSGLGNGLIAQCGTSGPSTTVTLASDEALRKGHLHIGMKVDVGTSGSPASLASASEITAVNLSTPSITIGTSVSVTGSNFVSRAGNGGAEITGLSEIISSAPTTGTIGLLNRATAGNEYWRNIANANGGTPRAVSGTLISTVFNEVRVAGGDVSLMIGTAGMEREVFELLQSQVRYVSPMDLKGGYKSIEFMGKPFVADVDHPFGRINFLDERFLKVFNTRDWHFLDEDGTVLKWVTGYDAWEAVLARYMNLGVTRCNVQAVLADLSGDEDGV